jgi:hypothetical protein
MTIADFFAWLLLAGEVVLIVKLWLKLDIY